MCFVIVFVFVIVFLLVRYCLLITLITCLKGQKSLRVLYDGVFQQCVVVSQLVSDKVTYRAVWGQLKSHMTLLEPKLDETGMVSCPNLW